MAIQYQAAGRTAKEISDSLEAGIRDGHLAPAAALPSVRALAEDLDVAAGTVAAAYRLLRERGLVEARGRSGTHVRSRPPLAARSSSLPVPAGVTDLAGGQPDPTLLPRLTQLPVPARGPAAAPSVRVLPELLEIGRERLAADGIAAPSLTLASGGLDGIHRVLSAHLRPGDVVAVEDPGWPNALDLVAALGLRLFPIAVDAHGPRPESLRAALRAGVHAVIITNRAHNPTGAYLTPERAATLRAELTGYPQVLTVEDDHAAELAHVELASVAAATRSWAFIRSTSKPYGPDLRVALIAGDDATIARVEGRMRIGSGWVSTVLQHLTVALWTSPKAASTVAKAAAAYDARRGHLIAELAARGVAAVGATGLNVWVPVVDETAAVTRLLQHQWAVAPGARFRQASGPAVRITISALTHTAIPQLADDVAESLSDTASVPYLT